jgi:hypothetical protein
MWCRLTRTGHKTLLSLTAYDPTMQDELNTIVINDKPTRVDVEAAYAAWSHVRGLLYKATFGPRGGKRDATSKQFVALRSITRELNYVDSHPALKGMGMVGWVADVFPVWKIDPDEQGRTYSPYPMPGHEFVILTPSWEESPGVPRITRWVEAPSAPGRLAEEGVHLRLWRHPVL